MSYSFVRRVAIAAAALPLLLSGCTEDEADPPVPDPTTSPPTTSEITAEPVEPTLPPEAQGKGPRAAEALVRHYYAIANYSQATGDTAALRSLGSRYCDACLRSAEALDGIYEQGGTIEGGDATVEKATVTGVRTLSGGGKLYYLTVKVASTDQTVSGSGDLDGKYPAGTVLLRYEVIESGPGLKVSKWYEK